MPGDYMSQAGPDRGGSAPLILSLWLAALPARVPSGFRPTHGKCSIRLSRCGLSFPNNLTKVSHRVFIMFFFWFCWRYLMHPSQFALRCSEVRCVAGRSKRGMGSCRNWQPEQHSLRRRGDITAASDCGSAQKKPVAAFSDYRKKSQFQLLCYAAYST